MLSTDEREQVERAIRDYGFMGRGELDALRAEADPDLPFELLARAVVEDPKPRLRWMALQVLDHYADHRYDAAVAQALLDPVPRVRRHAAHALACDACSLAPQALDPVPALARCIVEDDNTKVRRQAMWGLLTRRFDDRVRAAFEHVAAADPDERMRRDAAGVLRHVDARA